ncbi:MAG: hypothetical protein H0X24_17790 [Ktedonobacterales bacterium]|nr:hypothetical protein [Ktedonobacterales bacterium]
MIDLAAIVQSPAMARVAGVLAHLAARGLGTPAVASGFVRCHLLGVPPTDVDIHYVGGIPTATAEAWLRDEVRQAGDAAGEWDIWNFTEHDPRITSTAYGYRVHFVSTIDCVYLGADGALHDLTGRGVADADQRVLALTHLTVTDYPYTPGQLCYLYLEGCRRMYLYGLTPTSASATALRAHTGLWQAAQPADRRYLRDRVRQKLTAEQRAQAQALYARYGWDAVFTPEDGADV